METDLTKAIKKCTHAYNPKLSSSRSGMRTIRWADEVWTPTGIVDSIRFEDYYSGQEYLCPLVMPERFQQAEVDMATIMNSMVKPGTCFRDGSSTMDSKKCHGCVWRRHVYVTDMMVTCFEVKITLSDFMSSNGHNFHGNENFYCVPKELAPKIKDRVPSDVGILVYTGAGLRKYKECAWREIDDKTKVLLLYNALKKWCDGAVFVPTDNPGF